MHVMYVYCPWLLNILLLYNLGVYPGFLKGAVDPVPRSGGLGEQPPAADGFYKIVF